MQMPYAHIQNTDSELHINFKDIFTKNNSQILNIYLKRKHNIIYHDNKNGRIIKIKYLNPIASSIPQYLKYLMLKNYHCPHQ